MFNAILQGDTNYSHFPAEETWTQRDEVRISNVLKATNLGNADPGLLNSWVILFYFLTDLYFWV